MLRNYLVTAYRNLRRNKLYTVLNVIGLALGIGCSLVIFKVIKHELSYDKHHSNYGAIYRIVAEDIRPDRVDYSQGVPHPLAHSLATDFPEVGVVSRTHHVSGQVNTLVDGKIEKKFLYDEGLAFVDSEFFEIFDSKWVAGDKKAALKSPRTAVITVSTLKRFYDLEENQAETALGEMISLDNLENFEVIGVIEDYPETTNFSFQVIFDYTSQEKVNPFFRGGGHWNSSSSSTNAYFIAGEAFDQSVFDLKLIEFVEKYHGEGDSDEQRYHPQPLSDIHYSKIYENYGNNTPKESLYALAIIAAFLVLTAAINFVNLATAQAANRSKEIGIRKAIGSLKGQIVVQFFSEIFVITLAACILSLAIGELLFIHLEEAIGQRLSFWPFVELDTMLFIVFLLVVVTILSAIYPSYLLSRMSPVMALKNKITAKNSSGGLTLRKGLVIFQFAISQFMIIGTLVMMAQMDYFINKDLGFNREAIVSTYLPERNVTKMDRFRQAMISSSAIKEVSFALSAPTGNSNSHSNFNYEPLNAENSYHGNFKAVDERYAELYGIELLAGRGVLDRDSSNVMVINRKAADLMGFKDIYEQVIGEKLKTGWQGDKTVIGVMENFHSNSLRDDLDYVFLLNEPDFFYEIAFKTSSSESFKQATNHFEKVWEDVYPEYVIDWEFYDDQLSLRYEDEERISSLMRLFSGIAIIIGCLGLYGLISFVAMNRMKEIGIRKVLGASISQILFIFSKEVFVLLTVAFVIASPGAYFLLNQWLGDFQYSISIGPNFFVISFIISFIIAFLTISHRTIASAMMDPAMTLKDE